MAEEKKEQPEGGKSVSLKPKTQDAQVTKPQAEIKPPREIKSLNGGITIIEDNGEITVRFNPLVAEEIGAYRRCNVYVKFREGENVRVLQDVEGV